MSPSTFWGPAMVMIVFVTVSVVLACVAASAVRRSASRVNTLLLPALLIVCLAPIAPLLARAAGISIGIPMPTQSETPAVRTSSIDPIPVSPLASSASIPPNPGVDGRTGVHAPPAIERAASGSVGPWLIWLALLGTLIASSRLVVASIRLRRLVAETRPLPADALASAIERARRIVRLRRYPTIRVSDRIGTPVAIGWGRSARVLVPAGSIDRLDEDQWVHVLAHEGAHIAHRDPILLVIRRLALALWWWHPAIHWLDRLLGQAREALCDNTVLAAIDPLDYSHTLYLSGRLATSNDPSSMTLGLLTGRDSLEHRIRDLLDPRRQLMSRARPSVLITSCIIAASTCFVVAAAHLTERVGSVADSQPAAAEDSVMREWTLELPNSGDVSHLDIDIKRGDIVVVGEDRADIHVRLTVPQAGETAPSRNTDDLRILDATPIDFDIRRTGRLIKLDANDYGRITHVEVRVPRRIDLTLDSYRDGELRVQGVRGIVRARSQNNDIRLDEIAGSVELEGYNGNLFADLVSVDGELKFETYNGSIDLTLPAETGFTARLRTDRGVLRTNAAVDMRPEVPKPTEKGTSFDEFLVADVAGGGIPITLDTHSGDIVLRQPEARRD